MTRRHLRLARADPTRAACVHLARCHFSAQQAIRGGSIFLLATGRVVETTLALAAEGFLGSRLQAQQDQALSEDGALLEMRRGLLGLLQRRFTARRAVP